MRSLIRLTTLAAAVVLLTTPIAWAQQKGKPAPDALTGLAIGTKAPRFTLKDQAGKDRSLEELIKNGRVALVFYRSADW